MSLLGEDFVPLHNFQAGDDDYKNTCFIAVVANLRHVLEPVMHAVEKYTWKDYIHRVRSSWDGTFAYAAEHHGQHDAADFLSEILYDYRTSFGVEVCKENA